MPWQNRARNCCRGKFRKRTLSPRLSGHFTKGLSGGLRCPGRTQQKEPGSHTMPLRRTSRASWGGDSLAVESNSKEGKGEEKEEAESGRVSGVQEGRDRMPPPGSPPTPPDWRVPASKTTQATVPSTQARPGTRTARRRQFCPCPLPGRPSGALVPLPHRHPSGAAPARSWPCSGSSLPWCQGEEAPAPPTSAAPRLPDPAASPPPRCPACCVKGDSGHRAGGSLGDLNNAVCSINISRIYLFLVPCHAFNLSVAGARGETPKEHTS